MGFFVLECKKKIEKVEFMVNVKMATLSAKFVMKNA